MRRYTTSSEPPCMSAQAHILEEQLVTPCPASHSLCFASTLHLLLADATLGCLVLNVRTSGTLCTSQTAATHNVWETGPGFGAVLLLAAA